MISKIISLKIRSFFLPTVAMADVENMENLSVDTGV